ncbi:MAG: hypothetical protein KF893_26220 [Caldilineaceae bacterium]|nr:hypothetical protein [Caldilineaceae bacterium]
MSGIKEQWLVSAYGVVESYEHLWRLCDGCKDLLGNEWMAIAEDATRVAIEPWSSLRREAWTRGRLFGSAGEIQWRSYRELVRVALLVDAPDREKGEEVSSRLVGLGLKLDGPVALLVEAGEVALQTNNDEYTAAAVRTYGTEDQPGLFVRYAGWTERVKEQS